MPLLLWCSHKFDKKEPFRWMFLASICLLLSAGHPFILVMNTSLFIIYDLLLWSQNWRKVVLTIILFLMLFAWYIIPYSQVCLPPKMLGREPLAKGTFEYISDNNNFKIITLTQDKFLYIKIVSESKTLTAIWYFFLASQLFIVSLPTLFI